MTSLCFTDLQRSLMLPFRNQYMKNFYSAIKLKNLQCSHGTRTLLFYQYQSTKSSKYLGNEIKELRIPLPHGSVAAKAWGKSTGHPVLALHGWLDNCGTFDNLFPLLTNKLYIVAVDAPGHGMSSHKPPGVFDTDLSMVTDIKKIIASLGWQKFSIIAHSFGACLGLNFSSIFPEHIQKIAVIERVKPNTRDLNLFPGETAAAVKAHLEIERKIMASKSPPVYTEESAAERLREGMFDEVSLENAKLLNKRGTRPSECGKGVVFTIDIRCRTIEVFSRKDHDFVRQFMSNVQSELLMIIANNSCPIYETIIPGLMDSFYDLYKKNAKKFILHKVDGNHFVHLNNPERVAPLINDFFSDV